MSKRKNLERLATYLQSLPVDYKEFDMVSYFIGDSEVERHYVRYNGVCGTAACAVGHGPSAGLFMLKQEIGISPQWSVYAERLFVDDVFDEKFDFMFGDEWAKVDNHHYGAAARIRYFLAKGLPSRWEPETYEDFRIEEPIPLPPDFYTSTMLRRFAKGEEILKKCGTSTTTPSA